MAWTQADIDALKTAIADGRGARSIAFGDQSVSFNTSDMLALLAVMQQDVVMPTVRAARGRHEQGRLISVTSGSTDAVGSNHALRRDRCPAGA